MGRGKQEKWYPGRGRCNQGRKNKGGGESEKNKRGVMTGRRMRRIRLMNKIFFLN